MESLHIKFEFNDALNSKKTLLSTEINLLNIINKIQRYKELRILELSRKSALKSRLRETNLMIKRLKANLPKTKMPKETEEYFQFEKIKAGNLESELKEIKAKLASLD